MARALSKKVSEPVLMSSEYSWMWIFAIFIFLFIIATIVVVVVAIQQANDNLPDDIDIVIIDRDRGMSVSHVKAIDKYMGFRRNIYILTENKATGVYTGDEAQVYYVNFTPTSGLTAEQALNEYFLAVKDIKNLGNEVPDIAGHAMFLSDQTVPLRKIYKSYLFYGDRPRMFNIFRDSDKTDFFSTLNIYDYTAPTLVQDLSLFDNTAVTDLESFIFFEITEERVTLRNSLNRDIFVNGDEGFTNNIQNQFTELDDTPPYFATFHLSGNETDAATAVQEYLDGKFA